jgi:hypothetical protein
VVWSAQHPAGDAARSGEAAVQGVGISILDKQRALPFFISPVLGAPIIGTPTLEVTA